MAEYKMPYTAAQINEKLDRIDENTDAIAELNTNLIKVITTIHTSGATINANGIVSYALPTLNGYKLIDITSSCKGANNTNVIGFWDIGDGIIIFRNLTSTQITTGELSSLAVFIKA